MCRSTRRMVFMARELCSYKSAKLDPKKKTCYMQTHVISSTQSYCTEKATRMNTHANNKERQHETFLIQGYCTDDLAIPCTKSNTNLLVIDANHQHHLRILLAEEPTAERYTRLKLWLELFLMIIYHT